MWKSNHHRQRNRAMNPPGLECLNDLVLSGKKRPGFDKIKEMNLDGLDKITEAQARSIITVGGRFARGIDNHFITYSRNIFIPVSRLCVNDCTYCNFKKVEVECDSNDLLYPSREIMALSRKAIDIGCKEALICGGERADAWPRVRDRVKVDGIESGNVVEWLARVSSSLLDAGMLPHTNVGLLDRDEIMTLKQVNASMGLMLETTNTSLSGPGRVHERSPGKHPGKRLAMMHVAGELHVPFTTGILVGIGEGPADVIESLAAINDIHAAHGNIQEVIIQGVETSNLQLAPPSMAWLKVIVALARIFLPREIAIQVPPNLVSIDNITSFLNAGASDLGGISPLTMDYVNPTAAWPRIVELERALKQNGFYLRERLPVYDRFMSPGLRSSFICDGVYKVIDSIW